MKLTVERADFFWADLTRQTDWYRENAGPEIAVQFVDAVEALLTGLAETPGLGRPRFQDWPELAGVRSFRVSRPFQRLLIFYRYDATTLFAERLIHGARDLRRRLRESPYSESE